MRMQYSLLFLVSLVGACGRTTPTSVKAQNVTIDGEDVTIDAEDVTLTFFRPLASGTYVFRSQSELDSAWAASPFMPYPVGIVISEPVEPTYDYSEKMVIGISLGTGKWCFKPNIYKVVRNGTKTVAHYQVPTISTLACLRDGPLIAFALVSTATGDVSFVQDDN